MLYGMGLIETRIQSRRFAPGRYANPLPLWPPSSARYQASASVSRAKPKTHARDVRVIPSEEIFGRQGKTIIVNASHRPSWLSQFHHRRHGRLSYPFRRYTPH